MHRLNLLGGASIEGPDGPLDGAIAQRQRLAFLAILSASPTGLVSRDKLLALLWPDLDGGRARRALSNALYVIKKELGESSVLAVGDDLGLATDSVAVDASEFEEAVEAGELEKAVSIYTGPYLDGVHVKDSPEFEKWADGERDRLAGLFAGALEGLAEEATEAGDYKGAAQWWERLAVSDPYSSRIALEFMRALATAGDKAGALRYAQVHATLLREEFDVEPDRAIADLEKELRREETRGEPDHGRPERVSGGPGRPAEPVAASSPTPRLDPEPRPEATSAAGKEAHQTLSPRALIDGALQRAGKQRLFQWGLAYLAGAWFVLQALDVFSGIWDLSRGFHQTVLVLLTFGFFLTLVLVWYHGEKGRQRVTGPELLIIAALLFIAGSVLSFTGGPERGTPPAQPGSLTPQLDGRPTLAVLPFQNFSPNPADAYFADGMHEEILTKLSGIDSLRVISRSSVMQFRDNRPTAAEIASRLGADFLLEGQRPNRRRFRQAHRSTHRSGD